VTGDWGLVKRQVKVKVKVKKGGVGGSTLTSTSTFALKSVLIRVIRDAERR